MSRRKLAGTSFVAMRQVIMQRSTLMKFLLLLMQNIFHTRIILRLMILILKITNSNTDKRRLKYVLEGVI